MALGQQPITRAMIAAGLPFVGVVWPSLYIEQRWIGLSQQD